MGVSKEQDLQEFSSQQMDILANISHSVRTPIHTIMGMTDLALQDVNNPIAVDNYLCKIKKAGSVLINQINELLELTRLENNETESRPELCTFETIKELIELQLQLYTEDRQIEVEVNVEDMTRTTFMEDTVRLEQILMNLISNAAKFTPDGGKISVSVETLSVSAQEIVNRYTIADNGIGMSDSFQKVMFCPFMKEENMVNANEEGAGLGLYMVKRLIELMNGSIEVVSQIGMGTTVTVELRGQICNGQREDRSIPVESDIRLLQNKRILLCEDNALNAEMTRDLLENAGMKVDCVSNGQEAVNRIQSTESYYYDAVLMDIRMPVMNGLEATDRIRRMGREDTYIIPIVALTASVYRTDQRKALAAGMDAFLMKPFEVTTLLEKLAGFWSVYHKEQI